MLLAWLTAIGSGSEDVVDISPYHRHPAIPAACWFQVRSCADDLCRCSTASNLCWRFPSIENYYRSSFSGQSASSTWQRSTTLISSFWDMQQLSALHHKSRESGTKDTISLCHRTKHELASFRIERTLGGWPQLGENHLHHIRMISGTHSVFSVLCLVRRRYHILHPISWQPSSHHRSRPAALLLW